MNNNDYPTAPIASFHDAMKFMNAQQAKANASLFDQCKACWNVGGHLPVETLKRFAGSGRGAEWLESHPSAQIFSAMAEIETAFEILIRARASIVQLYGHFHATLMYDGFELTEEVALKTTHEVFKYVFAAAALVQAYRRFQSLLPYDKATFECLRKRLFADAELVAFVHGLRNCFGHQNVIADYTNWKDHLR